MNKNQYAFTLVELIVVITIVGILSTVWFVSYSGYLSGARDSNRFSQLTKLSDSLQTYAATKSLPLPDDYIEITASGASNVIAYQWYVWVDVLETIDYTNGGKDPKDDSYFTYYLTKDRKSLQLLAFMEDTVAWNILQEGKQLFAENYVERFPKVYGQKLWILISWAENTMNTPAQEISSNTVSWYLDIANAPQLYSALYDNDGDILRASWYALYGLNATRMWEKAPSECPEWFIWVPWNPEFNTEEWFCVAKYEMTHQDSDTANSIWGWTDYNSHSYVPWKEVVSIAWKYPIADIDPKEAVDACNQMWKWYHLITNNEWMTIARNIEANSKNWSTWKIGEWYIYNGVSGTSLGCNITWWNNEPRSFGTKTGAWNSICNPLRQLHLSNGQIIWDFAGNIWEFVNKANTLDWSWYNLGQTSVGGTSIPGGWDDNGIYDEWDMEKYGSALFLGDANGAWSVYQWGGINNNVIIRWDNALSGENPWIYSIWLWNTGFTNQKYIGFRCTYK